MTFGAIALAVDDFDNRSAAGPAVQSAITTALQNRVVGENVSVVPGDVTFPTTNRVHVKVYRTQERLNPVSTLLGRVIGVNNIDVSAKATAEAAPANAVTCVRPFMIPAKWTENQDPVWSYGSSFDRYDKKGDVIPNADVYNYAPGNTGYDVRNLPPYGDKGVVIRLRADNSSKPSPSFYQSWEMPGGSGAQWYEQNIVGCNKATIGSGLMAIQEPGTMTGPTNQGIDALIEQPLVGGRRVVDRRRVRVLGREAIVDVQYATADRLGEVAGEVAVVLRRTDHVSAAVDVLQHTVGGTSGGIGPD